MYSWIYAIFRFSLHLNFFNFNFLKNFIFTLKKNLGYVGDEAKTQESMLPGGWWRTGDMGFFDSKYQVYNLSGRSKDMIIRGGENIQPTEIEDFYSGHPGIDDIYVVGVPSKRLGEEVCAYIRVRIRFIVLSLITS